MTDEEIAKEYVDKLYAEKASKEDYDKDGWILYRCEDISDAFLAGIKAGRPKWHKVADGDLPPKDDVYLIYTTKGYLLGHYEQGGADDWVDYCGGPYSDFREYPSEEELMEDEVIAWCEIPQYTEE